MSKKIIQDIKSNDLYKKITESMSTEEKNILEKQVSEISSLFDMEILQKIKKLKSDI